MGIISPVRTDSNGTPRATGQMQSLGKDDFLKLLVSKLQNQDPLKPMDDQSFVAELAQFSSLEQMGNIADGIDKQNQLSYLQSQGLNNVMASGLIGKEVKAQFSTLTVDADNCPAINFTLDQAASNITLKIKDSSGQVVRTLSADNLPAGAGAMVWDGKDEFGNRVTQGSYTVEATATKAGGDTFQPALTLVGVVRQVIYRNGAAYLMVDGAEVSLGDVLGVGEPGTFKH
jgi:flagellar basal-body rod modification protein FlgD